MEDKKSEYDENSIHSDLSYDQECILNLPKSLTQLEDRISKKYGINMEDYLTADNELARITNEDILCKITDEIENNNVEDDHDNGLSHSSLSTQEALQFVKSLWTFSFQAFHSQMKIIFVQ